MIPTAAKLLSIFVLVASSFPLVTGSSTKLANHGFLRLGRALGGEETTTDQSFQDVVVSIQEAYKEYFNVDASTDEVEAMLKNNADGLGLTTEEFLIELSIIDIDEQFAMAAQEMDIQDDGSGDGDVEEAGVESSCWKRDHLCSIYSNNCCNKCMSWGAPGSPGSLGGLCTG